MVDVITRVNINAPLQKVAAFACNPDNAPKWYVNIKSAERLSSGDLATGSHIAFTAHFLGKKLSYTYEVVEFSETRFVMRTAQGPFPMETSYLFKRIDERTTEMTLRNMGQPSGFSKLFAPFMSTMMRKANQKDLNKIKSILESNES